MFRHLMQDGLHITELRSPQAFCIGQNRIQAALLDIGYEPNALRAVF